jgi:hypothetical protein
VSPPAGRASLRCVAAASAALWLAGCAGYQLGPTGGQIAGDRTVQIGMVDNRTDEPRLSETFSHALRSQIQRDGTYRLASRGDPDVTVSMSLLRFDRNPLTFQRTDVIATRDYDVFITAHVRALERGGRVLLDQDVTGRTTVRGNPDLASAERQAAPLLAENLARNIVTLLAEGTW